ncbi:hypothetical protein OXYTRIMIC_080 [Oxytricha trifallax]|uniref:Uncharacterized protein n=1 Tax=Oxytricha trifallax TaxID=1172189 RepID=A0A073IBG2_9SPIT|nr:hypothetical protein OXYTRIMIC_080 [Oxytricha trifallax]
MQVMTPEFEIFANEINESNITVKDDLIFEVSKLAFERGFQLNQGSMYQTQIHLSCIKTTRIKSANPECIDDIVNCPFQLVYERAPKLEPINYEEQNEDGLIKDKNSQNSKNSEDNCSIVRRDHGNFYLHKYRPYHNHKLQTNSNEILPQNQKLEEPYDMRRIEHVIMKDHLLQIQNNKKQAKFQLQDRSLLFMLSLQKSNTKLIKLKYEQNPQILIELEDQYSSSQPTVDVNFERTKILNSYGDILDNLIRRLQKNKLNLDFLKPQMLTSKTQDTSHLIFNNNGQNQQPQPVRSRNKPVLGKRFTREELDQHLNKIQTKTQRTYEDLIIGTSEDEAKEERQQNHQQYNKRVKDNHHY